jgi:hypothetical protein
LGGDANFNCGGQSEYLKDFIEEIVYKAGVDIYFSGHVHNYERMTAIYKNVTIPSEFDSEHKHVNPNAPVFILIGYPGNNHIPARVSQTPQPWS